MKLKVSSIMVGIIVFIYLIPSVPVLAYDGFQVGTYETLNSLVSDPENTQNIYNIDTSFFSSWTQEDYQAYFDLANMPFNPFNSDSLWVLGTGNNTGDVTIWCMDLTQVGSADWSCYTVSTGFCIAAFYNSQPSVTTIPIYIYIYNCRSNTWTKYSQSTLNLITQSIKAYVVNPDTGLKDPDSSSGLSNTYSFQWAAGVTTPFLWGNIQHVYSYKYWNYYEASSFSSTSISGIPNNFPSFMYANSGDTGIGYFDFFQNGNILYWNGDSFVDPDSGSISEESNLNHLYFNSCEIGFCEPSGVSSYNSFGGAYFYIKYSVDDWIRSHINDYDIYLSSTSFVGSRQFNGSKKLSLDSDGVVTIPFSDIFITDGGLISQGFIAATTNKRIENNFYQTFLYSVSTDKIPALLDKFNNVNTNSLSGAWDKLLDVAYGNWILTLTSTGGTSVITDATMSIVQGLNNYYSNFKIQCQVYLVDNDDNRSGSVGRLFDLALGSDTPTDNDGLVNDNPYIPDDEDEDFLPSIPSDTSLVTNGGSGTYIQNNVNVPNNFTIKYQDGVNDFIEWYNQDPEVSGIQNTFWGALGIFKGNPANELYGDMWGFLPGGFKSVIIGCASIGIIGAAATILRRRMLR